MAITYDLTGPDQDRLSSWHWLQHSGSDDSRLYSLTGVVRIELGAGVAPEEITLVLPFPAESIPDGKAFAIEAATPSFSLGSAGGAIEAFAGPGAATVTTSLPVRVTASASGAATSFHLSFHVALTGRVVDAPVTGPAVRVRQDVWKLAEWDPTLLWWARAINAMRQRQLDDPTGWRYQAAIHAYNRNGDPYAEGTDVLPSASEQGRFWNQCQHGSWYFLPWHRMYLGYFERIVAKTVADLGGPSGWTLPYWNYSDATNPTEVRRLPSAFRAQQTPDGDPNPLRVEQRAAGANTGQIIADDQDVNISVCLVQPTFSGPAGGGSNGFGGGRTRFSHSGRAMGSLEGTPHGSMHVAVGGFSPPGFMSRFNTAGLDATFWMHHANIDRLWTVWKKRDASHTDPAEADWLANLAFEFHDETGAVVSLTCGDVVDSETSLFAYRYEDESDPLAAPGPGLERMTGAPRGLEAAMEPIPEMVGASEEKISLRGGAETARVKLSRARGPSAALESMAPQASARVHLNIENVRGLEPIPYRVYVNVPDGERPEDHPELLAGALPMFGVPEASGADPEHPPTGVDYTLDITDLVARLGAAWNPDEMRVTFAPRTPMVASGLETVGAPEPIEIGRISVYESR